MQLVLRYIVATVYVHRTAKQLNGTKNHFENILFQNHWMINLFIKYNLFYLQMWCTCRCKSLYSCKWQYIWILTDAKNQLWLWWNKFGNLKTMVWPNCLLFSIHRYDYWKVQVSTFSTLINEDIISNGWYHSVLSVLWLIKVVIPLLGSRKLVEWRRGSRLLHAS